MVLGVFSDRIAAEDAINELEARGYNPHDVSIVMKGTEQARKLEEDTGAEVATGTVTGAATGGVVGALAGLLVATGVVPGLGALLIGGPLAAALGLSGAVATTVSGAATGALAGGLIGALTSWGVSREDAKMYEESIRQGGILLLVPARIGEEDEVRMVMQDLGAAQIRIVKHTEAHEYAQGSEPTLFGRREADHYGRMGYKGGETREEIKEKKKSRRK